MLAYKPASISLDFHLHHTLSHHTDSKVFKKQQNKTNHSGLKTDGNSAVSLWSNAFNFQKSWGTQVDPRTGTLTTYTKVGSMISNFGHGPNIDLEVNYNSNSLADPDHLGQGWSWNLTHFNLINNQLSTSQGKRFNLQCNKSGQWLPRYHKLKDIQIDGSKSTHFVITYANGLRETLNHAGYEVRLEQQDGRWVKFSYVTGTHLLSSIRDYQNHKISLTRKKGFITITSNDAEGKRFNVYLCRKDNKLIDIALPEENGQILPVIHMNYLSNLLLRITYPTGLQKNINYNCTNAVKIPLKGYNKGLCVVAQTSVNPQAGQPEMITRYTYNESNANEHNYLGFNSGLDTEPESNADALFETPASYTYKTTEDNGITRQVRTYNKYHLLIDAKIISDSTDHLLTQAHNFFCNTRQSNGCTHSKFEDLPVTYSLPLKTVTRNWGENTGPPATEITEQQYDTRGRLVSKTDTYGRTEKISYCPSKGDTSCPAEPSGWSLSSLVESVTRYPAYRIPGASDLPVIIQHNYYTKEPNRSGNGYILTLIRKEIKSGNQQVVTTQQYYNNHQDDFRYGLVKTVTIKGTVSPAATFNSVTKNFYYILNADHTTKTMYTAVKLEQNQFKRSSTVTTSLYTNQTIERTDAENKNITRYHYDHWGLIIQVDYGADTVFSFSKRYAYTISPGYLRLIITNGHGLSKKIIFDGAGRPLKIFTGYITSAGKAIPGMWLAVKSINYDLHGRIYAEHTYYVDNTEQLHQLITTFEYDALGRIYKVHLPDQEIQVKMYDDPDRCTVSFKYDNQKHFSPVSIIHGNILDKPIEKMVLPVSFSHDYFSVRSLCKVSNNEPATKVSYITYDGFGRKISFIDPAGRKVTITYDVAGRVIKTTDPLGNQFNNVYDLSGKVIEKWVIPVNDHIQYLLASAQYDAAGELLWKAGEDGKKTQYTYTENGQVATTVMPSGHVVSWQYNAIGLPVGKSVDGQESVHIDYDAATALPVNKRDITGITIWAYSDDGKVQQLFHEGENGYPDYNFNWCYDHNRRVISATNLAGDKILTHYDLFGRISSVDYQENNGDVILLKASVYDSFSRIVKVKYGSDMQRTINFDQYGQTKSVMDILVDKPLSAWTYSYDKTGNIVTLIHSSGDDQQAVLHYQYDPLNNLIAMSCSGSSGLPLCPRDTSFKESGLRQAPIILKQYYSFNTLNRMQQAKELLLNTYQEKTLSKTVNYNYNAQQTPLRPTQITTQWNTKTTEMTKIAYDIAGNMIIDGESNKINYNIFNQITEVLSPTGKQTRYLYDSDGREIKETTATGGIRNLFYTDTYLAGEKISQPQQKSHIISYLGVAKAIDGLLCTYYEQNYKGDVTGILTKTQQGYYMLSQQNIYSPYGMVWHSAKPDVVLPWCQQTFKGFDGEQTDPVTHWQFLGAGRRTYNPSQRYFVSEDPAGDGYAFGGNNPVMNGDPTGNTPKWLGSLKNVLGYAGTLGMAAFHKRWTNIIGTTLVAALCVTGIGISLYLNAEITPLITTGAGLNVGAGGLAIASAAVPTNRGVNIASAVVGTMAAVASFVMLGNAAVCGVSALVAKAELSVSEAAEMPGVEADIATQLADAPPPDYTEHYDAPPPYNDYDRAPEIENTLRDELNSFIRYDIHTGEYMLRITTDKNIRAAWRKLLATFSWEIGSEHIVKTFLLVSRQRLTGMTLSLYDMTEYLNSLSCLRAFADDDESFMFSVGFFRDIVPVNNINKSALSRYGYAFWNTGHHFGYMKQSSSAEDLWRIWLFDGDHIQYKGASLDEIFNDLLHPDLFVFAQPDD
ncbi:MAG: hypothetical protein OXC48_08890 [Endozoicomonadaceae bacterium]|nr:hypothetical protein [Endozoicomonadaceae bacterium]